MSLNRKHWFAVLGTAAAALAVVGCGEAAEEGSPPIMIDPTQVVKFQADASLQDVQDVAPSTTGEVWVLQREAAPHLFLVSINGADAGETQKMGWNRLIQTLDRGTFDNGKLLRLLDEIGYRGSRCAGGLLDLREDQNHAVDEI